MSYSLCIPIDHGVTALTLLAALTQSDGTPHATVRDLAVTEIAQGYYQLTTALIPDGYRGAAVIYTAALGADTDWDGVAIQSLASINPQETELSNAKTSDVPVALLDFEDGVETGITPRQTFRAFLSALAGVATGGNTATITFKNPAGDTTRVVMAVDADGNRSAVTLS